ncbi:hypothetical protein G6Z34_13945 [Clostridium perfringens]|uniref:DOD-type homing endonuclease domain-containing protein n=1 Tax=Clostridium perfringens TaxID=1502 RepID=A0AAP6WQD8_CLOPF|nr:hypothetical protein [Clostridium perfringens]
MQDLDIKNDYIGIAINNNEIIPNYSEMNLPFNNKDFWWMIGRYLGDGWTEEYQRDNYNERRVIICCSKVDDSELKEIIPHLDLLGFKYRVEKTRTTYKIHINNNDLFNYLQTFGKYAHGKHLNSDVLNLPIDLLKAMLNGYLSADGHYYEDRKIYSFKTVSKELAIGMMQVINKVYKRHTNLSILPAKQEYIESRLVNSKEKYDIRFTIDTRANEKSFYENGYIWTRLHSINIKEETKEMFNLSVYDDSSYVANSMCVHNCGVLPVNSEFTKHNAKMRTPSGEIVSQFDLHHSEYVGDLKYDFLNTKTASMIQKTLEMLVEYNKIQWQGSLRNTYDKYIHPDVIDRDSEELWSQLSDGLLISAFQYDSPVGEQAIKSIKPKNFIEAMNGNNLMRLMAEEGKDQPMDIYVRNKININEWYKEMKDFGLSEKDISIVEKHLAQDYGVCSTQERMMLMSMDKNISNFNVVESNILRKGVAKKIGDKFEEAHKLFYEKGQACGTSKKLLDYIWDVQIAMQKGYGFSVIHSVEYTWILAQQLNLIKYFPSIYWNTSVLLVESGALELEEVEDSDIKAKEKTTQYGKVASAISELQQRGITISLPDINEAEKGFTPIENKNEIMFGLKGIMNVNNNMATDIINNRPYSSIEDFYQRMILTKRTVVDSNGREKQQSIVSNGAMISLIKSGAFNNISNINRKDLLEKYITMTNPPKTKLDIRESTIDKIIEMGIIPTELKDYIRLYNFNKYIKSLQFFKDEEKQSIKWYVLQGEDEEETEYITNFFMEHFEYLMQEGEDKGYIYNNEGNVCIALGTSRKYSFKKAYDELMKPFFKWYKSKECLNLLNNDSFNQLKNKFMQGGISKWEMDSMNFYYSEHELVNVDTETYGISNFTELPEEAKIVGFTYHNGMKYPKFELTRIVGTVLDRDKNKHSVALLTPTGVVTVKFYSGQFTFYDKQISIYDEEEDKKTTLEESWFKRGTKLMITGYRRGDQFAPKKYKNSIYQHTVQKILDIDENGILTLQSERVQGD